ncbi:SU10 major capsid protein [Lentzea xinjiangensis]|uniref:SU10 major capsid protein n=1 Tax=Lentzea xinjiangensis TaxID=402600 RepID=UPI000B01DFD9
MSEPPATTESSDRAQIYGEICLEYRPDIAHGKITGLTTPDRRGWCVKFASTRYKQLVIHDLGVTSWTARPRSPTGCHQRPARASQRAARAPRPSSFHAGKDDRMETSTE